jgi:hypothetical protein
MLTMTRFRRPQFAILALVVLVCVGLALAGGNFVAILPVLLVALTTLDRSTHVRVAARVPAREPFVRSSTSRGPPFPSSR